MGLENSQTNRIPRKPREESVSRLGKGHYIEYNVARKEILGFVV